MRTKIIAVICFIHVILLVAFDLVGADYPEHYGPGTVLFRSLIWALVFVNMFIGFGALAVPQEDQS